MKKDMDEAMIDLLCNKAVFGLTDAEAAELAKYGEDADSSMDSQALELTAAMISLAGIDKIEPMPAHLESKIAANAMNFVGSNAAADPVEENIFTAPRRPVQVESEAKGSMWNWLGWAVATAACVALAVNIFTTRQQTIISEGPKPSATQSVAPSLAQLREALIAAGAEVRRANWGKGNVKEIEEISGDVVWSDAKQEGYMRFRGLPKNDPTKETYQLWIFEDGKLEPHPKDGGVFDVTADGEVIVPIKAKLVTKDPKVFAVTIEKPGGVVVSGREKIAALAKTETATS